MLSDSNGSPFLYQLSIACLLIANICFYTLSTVLVYLTLCAAGLVAPVLLWVREQRRARQGFRITGAFVWLSVIYVLFVTYGVCFLRHGDFNLDMIVLAFVSNAILLIDLRGVLKAGSLSSLATPIAGVVFVCIGYVVVLGALGVQVFDKGRLGAGLSGNVNSVGVAMGIMSLLLTYFFMSERTRLTFFALVCAVLFGLLTGSKKAFIFFVFSAIIIVLMSRRPISMAIRVSVVGVILCVAVLAFPPLYNAMGHRIVEMLSQLFGIGGQYSFSTESRLGMIEEGFRIYWDFPFFGGGEKYFAAKSEWGYDYSHCNYIEVLCNFGLFGFLCFYLPLFRNFIIALSNPGIKRAHRVLCACLLGASLVSQWTMVVYSETCVMFLPLLISFVLTEKVKRNWFC
ncbi:O-antigen ligase family protein [Adlercreutzia shanghongiae]|uniref:O-antigen ligase family protein n=1 Tax=Adlercreutzia shanghongiae TaxID=3111773 RepID=A0ABU6J129_9ACTN|nr:O-antigen ligase family protein [Adlercreutzia sp. R22]MEC4295537.1 O-antigen ligase family protein [Adlercreutzia sp. R22]